MLDRRTYFFSIFNVLGKFCESSIESFLVRIIIVPFICSFASILFIIILRLIGLSFGMESLVVRSEGRMWIATSYKRLQYFGLMLQLLFAISIQLIIIGWAFILITAKKMTSSGVTKPSLHVVCCYIFPPLFYISVLVSSIVHLILILLQVLELWMFSSLCSTYTNFCLPPAWNAWLWIERSTFYLL